MGALIGQPLTQNSIFLCQLLNGLDVNDLTPIMYCLKLGHNEVAVTILNHHVAKVSVLTKTRTICP